MLKKILNGLMGIGAFIILWLTAPPVLAQFQLYGAYQMHQGTYAEGATDIRIDFTSQDGVGIQVHSVKITYVTGPNAGLDLGGTQTVTYDNSGPNPLARVTRVGLNIPLCTVVLVEFCLWYNSENQIIVKSRWTKAGVPGDIPGIPEFEWDIRPLPGGGSRLKIFNVDTDTIDLKSVHIKYNQVLILPDSLYKWNTWDDSVGATTLLPGESLTVSTNPQLASSYLYFRAIFTVPVPLGYAAGMSPLQTLDLQTFGLHKHGTLPACSDGLDNDGDLLVDMQDFDCCMFSDTSEFTRDGCSDGCDNDRDAHGDWPLEVDCAAPDDTMESPACYMVLPDANGDTKISLPDIIWLVNFTFKGGQPPSTSAICRFGPRFYRGVGLQSIILLVNFIFKGAQLPEEIGQVCCQ